MNAFHIRTLQLGDAPSLLRFEMANRHWFERHIESRGDGFYSPDAVLGHIGQLLDAHSQGRFHPCVIADGYDAIIGRANLKNIDLDAGSAEVGYRIAESAAGRGLATQAVQHLIGLARAQWGLRQLHAYVGVRNTASRRVLEKCRFALRPALEDGGNGGNLLLTFALHGNTD